MRVILDTGWTPIATFKPGHDGLQISQRSLLQGEGEGECLFFGETSHAMPRNFDHGAFIGRGDAGCNGLQWVSWWVSWLFNHYTRVILSVGSIMFWPRLTILIFDATLWPQSALSKFRHHCVINKDYDDDVLNDWCKHTKTNQWLGYSFLGAMSVDEAVQICQSVSSGNPRTLCWFMLPQWHSSTGKCTVLKNRRLLEDKVVAFLISNWCAKNCQNFRTITCERCRKIKSVVQSSRIILGAWRSLRWPSTSATLFIKETNARRANSVSRINGLVCLFFHLFTEFVLNTFITMSPIRNKYKSSIMVAALLSRFGCNGVAGNQLIVDYTMGEVESTYGQHQWDWPVTGERPSESRAWQATGSPLEGTFTNQYFLVCAQ